MEIQVIDYQSHSSSADFAAALHEIGFAVIANHPIATEELDAVYRQWFEFFNSDEKHQFELDKDKHDGYVSFDLSETAKGNDIKDLKEFYHYYTWGRCPEHLKAATQNLYNKLENLGATLLQWLEDNIPTEISTHLSIPLSKMIEDSKLSLFRLLFYPGLKGDENPKAIRAAAHEDIDLLTVLPSATTAGLQVKNKEGIWLDVPRENGWIVINAGDMLQECTQGYYPSTTHRVVNPEGDAAREPRLSMPLFLHPRDEVILSERHTAKSYRWERYKELGLVKEA